MDGDVSTGRVAPIQAGGSLRVTAAMLSHVGCVRSGNEDAVIYSVPAENGPSAAHGVLALVADGMGGHAAGEVASQIAVRSIHHLFYRELNPVPQALAEGFSAANLAIRQRADSDPECAGMGTTCTAIVLRDGNIWLGHVGDSRAYLVRNGRIWRFSEDHSLVAELVRNGNITEQEARTSPDRNVILRALGIDVAVEPMIWQEGLPAKEGDVIVLCSDGLTDVIDDAAIKDVVRKQPPYEACQDLIQAALDAGAPDNVSVGVIAIIRDDGKRPVGRRTSQIASSMLSRG